MTAPRTMSIDWMRSWLAGMPQSRARRAARNVSGASGLRDGADGRMRPATLRCPGVRGSVPDRDHDLPTPSLDASVGRLDGAGDSRAGEPPGAGAALGRADAAALTAAVREPGLAGLRALRAAHLRDLAAVADRAPARRLARAPARGGGARL